MFLIQNKKLTAYGRRQPIGLRHYRVAPDIDIGAGDVDADDLIESAQRPARITVIADIVVTPLVSDAKAQYRSAVKSCPAIELYADTEYVKGVSVIFRALSETYGECLDVTDLDTSRPLGVIDFGYQMAGIFTNDTTEILTPETIGDIEISANNGQILWRYGGYYTRACDVTQIEQTYFYVFTNGGKTVVTRVRESDLARRGIVPPRTQKNTDAFVFPESKEFSKMMIEKIRAGEFVLPCSDGEEIYKSVDARKEGEQLIVQMILKDKEIV